MAKELKPGKFLSASRVKLLETCSWLYWTKYHLNVPERTNDGALRGSCCHLIFEVLLNPRHKNHFSKIIEKDSIKGSEAVDKLVIKILTKSGANSPENYEMVGEMILVGLKNDFFGRKGGRIGTPEQSFEIINDKPAYKIKGFMDKPIHYDKDKSVQIVDYKSSKAKFKGEELSANTQGMMYSLAARKLWPKQKKYSVDFLFLRFPKQPVQSLEFTKEQLTGFEFYLEYVNKIVDNFDEKSAKTNYAADTSKNKWLCSAGKWVCPMKFAFDYYGLYDSEGGLIKSSLKNDLVPKEGEKVEKLRYLGCPRHSQAGNDLLDF